MARKAFGRRSLRVLLVLSLAGAGAGVPLQAPRRGAIAVDLDRLPIRRRTFRTGTTPNVGRSGDILAALRLSREVGPITMYWTERTGPGMYDLLSRPNAVSGKTHFETLRALGFTPVLNMNPWTVAPGRGMVRNDGSASSDFGDAAFRRTTCEEAAAIAGRFRPTYLSIGNEVNSVYERLGRESFEGLASLEREMYSAVKAASPETRVLIVLSYSQLVDLSGKPRLFLLDRLKGCYDVLGLTTYPWRKYSTPADMPADYYRRLTRWVRAPIAFTEIGWSSDEEQGGSEKEQADFLVRFLELTRGMRLEFVNWAFLHDLPPESVGGPVVQRSHLGLGLRRLDGSAKPVWRLFKALADLPGP